ncbi:MAG: type VI secretion system baseplate subunit TssK [Gammaproteobacteria bacterium]|nr:type VI secretion system baseplate subunit TssK [Gammaproteobacteria bacterium]
MSKTNRTAWTEGMFLGPQHFQQHDRFLLNSLAGLTRQHGVFSYGFVDCAIDTNSLAEGKFSLTSIKGLFADGTPFSLPDDDELPDPIDISPDTRNQVVSLAIPYDIHSDKDIAEDKTSDSFSRYLLKDQTIRDRHSPDASGEETVFTAGLWTRLVLDNTDQSAYYTIPIARIVERRSDDSIVLDPNFYPCAASLRASEPLQIICKEILGMLHQRASELAGRLGTPNASDTSQLVQFLLLQMINRYKPLFKHMVETENDHPERIYREFLQLAGELSTITRSDRLGADFPPYLHRDQYASFVPLVESIRQSLNWIPDSTTESIAVNHVKAGIYTATVHDKHLFESARFILAVKARVTPDELQRRFPRQTTISSKNKLRELVEAQSRGIELSSLVTVPNSIPMYENNVYFEMRQGDQLWQEIAVSGDIAMHIAGSYSDLSMQIWTIQK